MKVIVTTTETTDPQGEPIFWANIFFDSEPKASLPFRQSSDRNEFIQELMVGLKPQDKSN